MAESEGLRPLPGCARTAPVIATATGKPKRVARRTPATRSLAAFTMNCPTVPPDKTKDPESPSPSGGSLGLQPPGSPGAAMPASRRATCHLYAIKASADESTTIFRASSASWAASGSRGRPSRSPPRLSLGHLAPALADEKGSTVSRSHGIPARRTQGSGSFARPGNRLGREVHGPLLQVHRDAAVEIQHNRARSPVGFPVRPDALDPLRHLTPHPTGPPGFQPPRPCTA